MTDEELLRLLSEYRKPDKFSKLTVIPGHLKVIIEPVAELPNSKSEIFKFRLNHQLPRVICVCRLFKHIPSTNQTVSNTSESRAHTGGDRIRAQARQQHRSDHSSIHNVRESPVRLPTCSTL